MSVPAAVLELVKRFDTHAANYQSSKYNEAQLRQEFVNPLFEALGWDMANAAGHAEAYKDVIHEDAIKIGGQTKAPDYCFRIGGTRKFFLEAKKPFARIKDDRDAAYQLRRYAWSAKLPVSVLTNFAEFAVYDCRKKPSPDDKASVGRVHYFTRADYAARWDEIAGVFSKEAILKGSFDKYAESSRGKRGTATVDAAFLEEIEGWRDQLARNLAARNPKLTQPELNYAVQTTIDRIVFLRMCEDRGIEPYGRLRDLLERENVYQGLLELFALADAKYNSGLFHFDDEEGRDEPDVLTPELVIDDKVLQEILKGLYFPESPYEFSVLPADILGQVYEQFLGKVIRLTAGHQAKVEAKPEVKKAGGVFYTPSYVVQYVVEQTVGKLLPAGTTPKDAAKLRVLDPACGSGSFLLGAYQYLLDWHRDWYVADGPKKHPQDLAPAPGGGYRLTTIAKKRILLDSIFGVDIDPQAVEVTKLSLLLKVLDGETKESLEAIRKLAPDRALPDLDRNIRCGNSLVAPDYTNGINGLFGVDEEELERVNSFDWEQAFSQVFKARAARDRGFDAVVGNPPYVRMEGFKDLKAYLRSHYETHDERSDLYVYFLERAHRLLREGGRFGMILSNKFIRANYGQKVRRFLDPFAVETLVDLAGLPVFRGATVRTVVLLTTRAGKDRPTTYVPPPARELFAAIEAGRATLADAVEAGGYPLPPRALTAENWSLAPTNVRDLTAKLTKQSMPLIEVCGGKICRGVVSGLNEAFVIDGAVRKAILAKNREAAKIIRPFIQGRDIGRYLLTPPGDFLIYTHHGIDMRPYPAVLNHLLPLKQKLLARATDQEWYELQQPQYAYLKFFEGPKIVFPDMATSCRFAVDRGGHFGANTVYFLPTDDLFLLGVLNSRVGQFYFRQTCAALEGPGESYLRFFGQYLEQFPVCADPSDSERARVVKLVERLLTLHEQYARTRLPTERTALKAQIAGADKHLDRLVYDQYGLSEKEIATVEAATGVKS